ncbi:tetratricopeptide repeat protein [Xanthomonas sp. 1678]|uniref:serine/threonine-protein kinase n=1 Tax=Xanthomonas sp. 1678 TaxID=3158788 RepID=UPI002863BFAA|nr:serine/threonine-protein kinase [Xanthomonas translucens]
MSERWQQVRHLFEAVCDLPPPQWQPTLERLSHDPALVQEVLALLAAQTVQLQQLAEPLRALAGRLAAPELGVGDRLGPWRLTRFLASGGMGSVFVAERADEQYQRQVAVKLLRGLPDALTAQRLAAERQILASLQHPNIARLYDGGATPGGQPYLVMEYVDGVALDRYLQAQAPDLPARLQLFLRICRAVQAAHQRLVLHCDLKPGNVLVRADGEPVLLDFGIARLQDAADGAERGRFCTPPYASPELLAGQPVGVASDVYSLGVMLVEVLAEQRLPAQTGAGACPRPSALAQLPALRRKLRGDLDAIAAKACAADPAQRYANVADLAADLQRYLGRYPVHARRGGRRYALSQLLRRRWKESAAVAAMLLLSGGFMWRLLDTRAQAQREAAIAQQVSQFLTAAFDAADPRKRGARGTESISARQVLDSCAMQLDQGLAQSPAVRARLRATLGLAYMNLGQGERAEAMLRRAATELQSAQVDEPALAAAAWSDLATLLANDERGDDAQAAGRQALALATRSGDLDALAKATNALGLGLHRAARYAEAQAMLQRSLALRRQPGVKVDGGVATVLHNLGLVFKAQGQYAQAEQWFRQALAMKQREYGTRSVDYLNSAEALAQSLAEQGALGAAAAQLAQNLELARALYGERSEQVASAENELASVQQDAGDYAAARSHYARALALLPGLGLEGSVDHARYLNNLATLEESRGALATAEALYRQSWQIRRQRLGADNPMTLNAEGNLGRMLMRQDRLAEAEPLLTRAADGMARLYPADHPRRLIQSMTRIEWSMRRGELARAQRELDALQPASGWPSPQLQRRRDALAAELAQRAGDVAQAVRGWQRLVQANQAELGADAVPTAMSRVALAESLIAAGRHGEAQAQLGQAQPVLTAQLAPEADALRRLLAGQALASR